jgi:hypothetical protein
MVDLPVDCPTPRTRAENAAYVVQQIRALGVKVNDSSRLMRMKRVLDKGYVSPEDPDFPIALESMRDMQHIGFAFDQMNAQSECRRFRDVIRRLLKDSPLPHMDREESTGRNAQLELYLAALCQRAGMGPVDYEEPDVTCVADGIKFGIAAKRVKSLDQVRKHVKKAAEQVEKSKLPGIVVLDLSMAWNRQNMPITSGIMSQLYEMTAIAKTNQFFTENRENIERWVQGKGVLAVLVLEYVVRLRRDRSWNLEGMSNWFSTTFGDLQADREFDVFYRNFLKGFTNLIDFAASSPA